MNYRRNKDCEFGINNIILYIVLRVFYSVIEFFAGLFIFKYIVRHWEIRCLGYVNILFNLCLIIVCLTCLNTKSFKAIKVNEVILKRIGIFALYSTSNLILSALQGSIYAAYLSIYLLVMWFVSELVLQVSAFVHTEFENKYPKILFDNSLFLELFLGIGCTICFLFLVQPFILVVWGNIYLFNNTTVILLAIILIVTIMIQLLSQNMAAYEICDSDRLMMASAVLLNIVISVCLVKWLDIDGILIGLMISSILFFLIKLYNASYWNYIHMIVLYFAISIISVIIISCLTSNMHGTSLYLIGIKTVLVGGLSFGLPISFLLLSKRLKKRTYKYFIWCVTLALVVFTGCMNGKYDDKYPVENGNKSRERKDSYSKENGTLEEKIFHLSFDDVIEIFEDITENGYESIFENENLGWMRQMHDQYGVTVSCYVFFQNEGFSLDECTTKFRTEFEDNADWLRFGFHSFDPEVIYGKDDSLDILRDYNQTVECLKKIVGKGITNVIRLHYYSGKKEDITGLMKNGTVPVKGLLCADDLQQSYYLSKADSKYIYCHDEFTDSTTGMNFFSTDFRVEYVKSMDHKIKEFSMDSWNNQLNDLVVFTHEWALNNDVKEKINDICVYAVENGYKFVFFEDI